MRFLLPCNAGKVSSTLQDFILEVWLFLLDPLRKLGGVVAHRFFERNFEFERNRNLLAFFIFLGLGWSQEIPHGAAFDLLPDCITHFTVFRLSTKLHIVDLFKNAAFHRGVHLLVRNCLFFFDNAKTNGISPASQ